MPVTQKRVLDASLTVFFRDHATMASHSRKAYSDLLERAFAALDMDWRLEHSEAVDGPKADKGPCLEECKAPLSLPIDNADLSRWVSDCDTLQGSMYSKDISFVTPSSQSTSRSFFQEIRTALLACIPDTRWTTCLIAILFSQLALCISFEVQMNKIALSYGQGPDTNKNDEYIRAILVSQVITVTVEVWYQLILGLNAVRVRNIVHVVGICLNNSGILLFVVLAGVGVEESVLQAAEHYHLRSLRIYAGLLLAVLLICTLVLAFTSWRLSAQFAWAIYRHIASGDLQARRRYLMYEIYISLLHLDFFLLGFWIQSRATMRLAQAATFGFFVIVPVTPFQLFLAGFSARRESRVGSALSILLLLAQCAAIITYVIGMYTCDYVQVPPPARQRTLAYAAIALPVLLGTTVMTVVCMRNYGLGLRVYTKRNQIASDIHSENTFRDFRRPWTCVQNCTCTNGA